MARGASTPAPNALPKVSFVKVTDEVNKKNPGVHDHVAKTYGYNDGSEFERPKHYIRYIEPLESDLAVQVEYDMDEQDQDWLDTLNAERKAQQLDKITYETFEIVMDRLEKEWFDLTKNIPKTDMALPSEDSTCAICDDSEGENTNAIVFCDGCNLAVHQDCYGVPYIPEGQWLCRKCTVSPENPVGCILCPNEGGAFKQTVSGDWVHLLCAIWIPETSVANEVFMEPITGVEKISKQRWKLRCSICDIKYGACVQCTKASCFTAFHATCARKEKFLMPMKASQGSEAPTLACYCEKHLPLEQQEARAAMHRTEQADDYDGDGVHPSPKSNKTMRAYNKQYKPGPPLVPRIIVNRILQYISKIHIRHKPEFVHLVCKYWSLKREARRGAPLLKRLHLEPWTALSGSKQQTDEEKTMKLDHMKRLRMDLERLRLIADVVQRRERTKQKEADEIQEVLLKFFYMHEGYLRLAFEHITSLDRQGYFKSPVSKSEVPDYYDIIKVPMCWDVIDQKLDRHEYLDTAEFKHDVSLVVNNALTYNQPNTPFYRTALRIQATAAVEFAKLDKLVNLHLRTNSAVAEPEPSAEAVVEEKPEPGNTPIPEPAELSLSSVGDLEPPLDILNLLVSEESIRPDTDIIMTSTPIECLLRYELPLIRPPAPPLPPLPAPRQKFQKRQKAKSKQDKKAASERKKLERKLALDASPGFRAPRTRAALAAAAAFEAEAEGEIVAETPEQEQPVAGPSSSPDHQERERTRKPRRSTVAPLQDLSITVEDVDPKQSFKMFEVGWILPADHRRGGRVPIERGPVPPPRKRAKTAHDKSRLSHSSPAPAPSEGHSNLEAISVSSEHAGTVEYSEALSEPPSSGPIEEVPSAEDAQPEARTFPKAVHVSEQRPSVDVADDTSIEINVVDIEEPSILSEDKNVVGHSPESGLEQNVSARNQTTNAADESDPITFAAPEMARADLMEVDETMIASQEVISGADTTEAHPVVLKDAPTVETEPQWLDPEFKLPPEPEPESEEEDPGPRRIIIIEELDTPATRREKYKRRKAERLAARERAAAEARGETVPSPADNSAQIETDNGQPSRAQLVMDLEGDSDLTDLSSEDDGETEVDEPMSAPAPVVAPRAPARPVQPLNPAEPGSIMLNAGERLEGGTLVWAKLESFPWWPAVVFEEDDTQVPQTVLSRAHPTDGSVGLVRFYEKNSVKNWAWVKLKNMRYLGEDDALDAQMLAPSSKYQRWRNATRRSECRNAYQDALAEMEAEDEAKAKEREASQGQPAAQIDVESPMTEIE